MADQVGTQGVQSNSPIGAGSKYDELWETHAHLGAANTKRTYDEMQQESLETIRRSRDAHDRALKDADAHSQNVNNLAVQALQNAVETANLVGKQAVQHRDIALDRQWNLPEEIMTAAKASGKQEQSWQDMIRAEAIKAVESAMAKK